MSDAQYRDVIYSAYLQSNGMPELSALIASQNSRTPYLKKIIKHHFPKSQSANIVDLGCGSGALISLAEKMGYHNVVGVDYSEQQVAAAHALGQDKVRQGDLFEYLKSLPDAELDLVIAFDVIEHLTKNELLVFANEVQRVLKSGGRWILHTPNAESPFFGRIRYGDYTHELAFTQESIRQLLISLNFSQVSVYEDQPAVHGLLSAGRYIVWKLMRMFLSLYLMAETGERHGIFSQNLLAVAKKA